jgi:hypothetical protein
MLQIWLDDSGRGQRPAFVLAGYFSSVDAWIEFSDEWKALLQKRPALRRLKAYEAFGLRGEFKGRRKRIGIGGCLSLYRLFSAILVEESLLL